jgi:archaellum component FlaC
MMFGILVMITALSISAVAIYYSVSGLVAIFAAAAVPIMIMGGVLEIGKLVTAVWLHKYWKQAKWWLKTYLSVATVVLMFITSMGIFGFLSRAHIEQTANATEGLAQITRIETEIDRQTAIIDRAEQEIIAIQTAGTQSDNTIQQQIDREQQRIDTAYARIQPAIDEQLAVIEREEAAVNQRVATFQIQLDQINLKLSELTDALNSGDIRRAQGIVGARQDGALGPNTSAAIDGFRTSEEAKRNELLERIDNIRTAPNDIIAGARAEIARLRNLAESQIAESNELINRLRNQLGVVDIEVINQNIATQESIIAESTTSINTLTEQKYALQAEYRKLEAEVGPVKYLAEFVYGETANQDLLEEAVRWVIIIIIFVFDPLAVLLLIASQATFEMRRQEHLRLEPAEEITNDNTNRLNDGGDDWKAKYARTYDTGTDAYRNQIPTAGTDSRTDEKHATDTGTDNDRRMLPSGILESREEERRLVLEEKEKSQSYQSAKKAWKIENPNKTIKQEKDRYINGMIDNLPWEDEVYQQNSEQNENSIWNKIKREE